MVQYSEEMANFIVQSIETIPDLGPTLKIFTGTKPANCAAADSGTQLAEVTLPGDWLTDPAGGSVSLNGTWEDLSADNSGTAGHWRLYRTADSAVCAQGTCSASGGGGDLILSTTTFTAGQPFSITTWTWSLPV